MAPLIFNPVLGKTILAGSLQTVHCSYSGLQSQYFVGIVHLGFTADDYSKFDKAEGKLHERHFGDLIRPVLREHGFGCRVLHVYYPVQSGFSRISFDGFVENECEPLIWDLRYLQKYKETAHELANQIKTYLRKALNASKVRKIEKLTFAYFFPRTDRLRVKFYVDIKNALYFDGDHVPNLDQRIKQTLVRQSRCSGVRLSNFHVGTGNILNVPASYKRIAEDLTRFMMAFYN
ncbi:unnamed protein product [Echinostoma caproni]|uniref:FERM domain-containing protein n=1 Tax=Echinostoma caproni TaxID=27848 RepID=A0A183AUQ7_9TREM|nr:unnamed protein product [Echinostoma caproni]